METPPGTIILLNGTATAGKSSLATAVQETFAEPYLLLGLDTFVIHVSPARYRTRGVNAEEGVSLIPVVGKQQPETEFRFGPFGHALISAMHYAIAAVAASGHNVVVDYCLQDTAWIDEWLALWARLLPTRRVGRAGGCTRRPDRGGARSSALAVSPRVTPLSVRFDDRHIANEPHRRGTPHSALSRGRLACDGISEFDHGTLAPTVYLMRRDMKRNEIHWRRSDTLSH